MRNLWCALVVLSLTACMTKPAAQKETEKSPEAKVVLPPTSTPDSVKMPMANEDKSMKQLADKEASGMKLTLKPIPGAKKDVPAVVSKRGPVPADKALGWLKNGNKRFSKSYLRKDGQSSKDRMRLVEGQKPHSIVLSCSDSRVPPEIVFDQKLGEIFVVRTAGEALDFSAIASIEYAVEHLGSNLILVMGHESCGAVKAALAALDGSDAGSPWLNKLVNDLRPHLMSFKGKAVSEGALVEAWANTEGVAKDLVARSQIVRDAVNTGEVKIQTALYHLGSGEVEFK